MTVNIRNRGARKQPRKRIRSAATRKVVLKLRQRVAESYAVGEISRDRMGLLMKDLDLFEKHAYMPKALLTGEQYNLELAYQPPETIRLGKVPRIHVSGKDRDAKWVRHHYIAPLTHAWSVWYGNGRRVPYIGEGGEKNANRNS